MKVGDKVPSFSLPDHEGNIVSLKNFLGKKHIVLFFYPKDDTPGWTAQVCEFRDMYHKFIQRDAVVLGVSSDSNNSHQRFIEKHKLPFPLLVDRGNKLRELLKVPKTLFVLPGRVTFVIDKSGTVKLMFNSASKIKQHISKSLAILEKI